MDLNAGVSISDARSLVRRRHTFQPDGGTAQGSSHPENRWQIFQMYHVPSRLHAGAHRRPG